MARRVVRYGVSSLTRMRAMPLLRVGRNTYRGYSGKRPNFTESRTKTSFTKKRRSARRRGNLRR